MTITSREIGWAAGILEGEGSMRHTTASPRVDVVNTDLWVLEKFMRIVGCGKIEPRNDRIDLEKYPNRKLVYYWRTTTIEEAKKVAWLLFPDLSPRRKVAAQAILDHVRKGYGNGPRREYGDFCNAGHELTPETTWVTKQGKIKCNPCNAERQREHRARKKEKLKWDKSR